MYHIVLQRCHRRYASIGDPTKDIHLYKHLSATLARRIISSPAVPTTDALEIIVTPTTTCALLAVCIPRNRGVWGVVIVPCTVAIGASQLHTGRPSLLFLQGESLLQPKLERVSTVRERSVKDMPNVSFHESNRPRVSGF